MDKNLRPMTRLLALALFPVALAALAPLALLVGALFYLGGLVHAVLQAAGLAAPLEATRSGVPHQTPHFLDMAEARIQSDRKRHDIRSN